MQSRARTNGFTLVEVVIATTMLAAIFGAAFTVVVSGSSTVEDGIVETELKEQVRNILDRVSIDLRSARIEPVMDPEVIHFRKLHGTHNDGFGNFDFDSAEILWNEIPLSRYEWSLAPGETLNDVDDDGDGLVDEGVLIRTVNGMPVVLSSHVAERGFTLTVVDDDRLVIRLVLETVGRGGRVVRERGTAVVYLRN